MMPYLDRPKKKKLQRNYKNERLKIFRKHLYDCIISIIIKYTDDDIIILFSQRSNNFITINPFANNEYQLYPLNPICDRMKFNKRARTFGNTICNIYVAYTFYDTYHFVNYYFQCIDIFDAHSYSKEILISNYTDVGFLNGNVYIIERNFGNNRFKQLIGNRFVDSGIKMNYDRLKCVFVSSELKLFAIGGEFPKAKNTIEVFDGISWKLLDHKLTTRGCVYTGACRDAVMIDDNIYILTQHCYDEKCYYCSRYNNYIIMYNILHGVITNIYFPDEYSISNGYSMERILSINNKLISVYTNGIKTLVLYHEFTLMKWIVIGIYNVDSFLIMNLSPNFSIRYKKNAIENKLVVMINYIVDIIDAQFKSKFWQTDHWDRNCIW